MLRVLLLLLVASSAYNIYINYGGIISFSSINNGYAINFKGFFYNRNVFGFMMASGIAFATYLWTIDRQKRYLYSVIVLSVSLIATLSRGSLLFTALFLFIFTYMRAKSKLSVLILVAGIFAIVLPPLAAQPFVKNNIIRAENTDTGRSALRSTGLNYFLHNNPAFGAGQQAIDKLEADYGHSSYHNLYIESLATQGIIGLSLVLLGIGFSGNRIKIIKKKYLNLGSFLQAFLYAYIVYAFFEALSFFYSTPNSILVTYVVLLFPMLLANGIVAEDKKYKAIHHA